MEIQLYIGQQEENHRMIYLLMIKILIQKLTLNNMGL